MSSKNELVCNVPRYPKPDCKLITAPFIVWSMPGSLGTLVQEGGVTQAFDSANELYRFCGLIELNSFI